MSSRTHLTLAIALLGLAVGSAFAIRASADETACGEGTCVIMIEVDGLEPEDLDPQKTPLLWELARQGAQGVGPGTNFAGAGRNGYVWQAPRGVMSASSATSTASLLTGGYAAQHAVVADEYIEKEGTSLRYKRRVGPHVNEAAGTDEDTAQPITEMDATSLFEEMSDQLENSGYAWITGDPYMRDLLDQAGGGGEPPKVSWAPTTPGDGIPAGCPWPRRQPPSQDTLCSASDGQTLRQAETKLQHLDAGDVAFAYIHLAGVGQTKLRDANVAGALQELDLAIGRFLQSYSSAPTTAAKWANTVLMVVGSHGYERTGAMRVPGAGDPGQTDSDLEHYIEGLAEVTFVPQGSFATVYPTASAADPEAAISVVRANLENEEPGSIQAQCNLLFANQQDAAEQEGEEPPTADELEPNCIRDALYVNPRFGVDSKAPAGTIGTNTIDSKYKSWHYDHVDKTGARSGSSGELVVTAGKGWAFGRTAPANPAEPDVPITNPYPATAGGPRNRAIAAFVNGPSERVRAMNRTDIDRHPVTKTADTGDERQEPATTDLAVANENPVDDANATGHELQPETVDFMPTAAALLKVSVGQRQLVGRLLEEAFPDLAFPVEIEDIGDPIPDEEPPPPPPAIIFPAPPPPPVYEEPKDPFPFYGLLQKLRATVVDAKGERYAVARPASRMSHMVIKADFGKPLTMVALTFYRDVLSKRDRATLQRCSAVRRRKKRAGCLGKVVSVASRQAATDRKRCKQEDDASKKDACLYEVRARARFEKRRRGTCSKTLVTRLRRARGDRNAGARKALKAPCLVPLARFDPFTVRRGRVELKLKVPSSYAPSHTGMTVQEVRKMTARERSRARERMEDKDKPLFPYIGFGPKDGAIAPIADARRLHRVKPRRTRPRSG